MIFSSFFLMALGATLFTSISAGIVGSYVVVKRIVFISGSIAHSVLGGMGLFLFLNKTYNLPWLSPTYGALLFAILSAFLIGWIHLRFTEREDTVIGAIWASGMAIGVIFISLTPGYTPELLHFLFGNILWTTPTDLLRLGLLASIVIICALIYHKKFTTICFDERQAYLQKIPVVPLYFLLLSLIAITTVLLIQVIGAILVIAMLSLPPAIASRYTSRLKSMIFLSIFVGFVLSFIGIFISFTLNWPPGATIALTTTIAYLTNLVIKK
ncbi:MAG: metal ABC transporter permease [Candidatus Algichlamydia australiensis]|nr:metal ABC transporter permease [Chlamydiales bacterium]